MPDSTSATSHQSPQWVDRVVDGIEKWREKTHVQDLHVDDMKTPSGRVHTGALRGVMIHDIVAAALQAKGIPDTTVKSTYVFNDMDPMDALPGYLDSAVYTPHMGKPLYRIPAPSLERSGVDFTQATAAERQEFSATQSFAEFYALDFIKAFRQLGCQQEIVWSHELYESGKMDETIRFVLDHAAEFKAIYERVAKYQLPEQWYPFQVICPQCGKIGTTTTTGWDGEQVTFTCEPHKVAWAQGCGHTGVASPFGGNGKLLWKVDWPAHWRVLGVTVEGAGKDHSSAGGSRDMANAFCREIFDQTVPFDIPYEWILIRGTKMSSSKGIGTSAREFIELFPPAVGRFLFVHHHFNQVIDFDPQTLTIPDLFDNYDLGAQIAWGEVTGDQRLARAFTLSQIGNTPAPHFLPRFRDVAVWMQHPEINLEEKFAEIKGAPLTAIEKAVLTTRQHHARVWIERYAPEEFNLQPRARLPEAAQALTAEQRTFLKQVGDLMDAQPTMEPGDLQQRLFTMAKESLGPRAGFTAIYLAFLGKTAGPRAGWFLNAIDPELRRARIRALTE